MKATLPMFYALAASLLGSAQAQLWETPQKTLSQPLAKGFQVSGNVRQAPVLQNKNTRLEVEVVGGVVVGIFAVGNSVDEVARAMALAWGMDAKFLPELIKNLKNPELLKEAKKGFIDTADDEGREILGIKTDGKQWRLYIGINAWADNNFPAVKSATGNPNAKNVIRVFSDFQCPYCKQFADKQLADWQKKPNEYLIYHYHFPLSFHKNAFAAAEASECAGAQGKFWPFTEQLSAGFDAWSKVDTPKANALFAEYAGKLGLNTAAFKTCQSQRTYKAAVEAQQKAGLAVGVQGTPSVFLNGVRVKNYTNARELNAIRSITQAKPTVQDVLQKRLSQFR